MKDSTEICERNCIELYLVGATPDGSTLLEIAVRNNTAYRRSQRERDIALGTVYTFSSEDGRRWLVTFGLETKIKPETAAATDGDFPRYFLHFNPSTMIYQADNPIGSLGWWRVQACTGPIRHRGMPGYDGAWTARWDKESGDRRPARIVQVCPFLAFHPAVSIY